MWRQQLGMGSVPDADFDAAIRLDPKYANALQNRALAVKGIENKNRVRKP